MLQAKKDTRKKIIFLGTPHVASYVLERLIKDASLKVQVCLVVTQAPSRAKRCKELVKSPVHKIALSFGIAVLTPDKTSDPDFLNTIRCLAPDLCLTAAYGNILPEAFLQIPKFGTINIHPSLLPKYRGAAPVQRAIEDGMTQTGVTLLLTVLKMDAGPIISQEKYDISHNMQYSELIEILFQKGTHALIRNLRRFFTNKIELQKQCEDDVTIARKVKLEDAHLNLNLDAKKMHDKVRAFSDWPKARLRLKIDENIYEVKVHKTELSEQLEKIESKNNLFFFKNDLFLKPNQGDKVLKISEIQFPGKNIISAQDFKNSSGLKKISAINF